MQMCHLLRERGLSSRFWSWQGAGTCSRVEASPKPWGMMATSAPDTVNSEGAIETPVGAMSIPDGWMKAKVGWMAIPNGYTATPEASKPTHLVRQCQIGCFRQRCDRVQTIQGISTSTMQELPVGWERTYQLG